MVLLGPIVTFTLRFEGVIISGFDTVFRFIKVFDKEESLKSGLFEV